jgi:protein TonB
VGGVPGGVVGGTPGGVPGGVIDEAPLRVGGGVSRPEKISGNPPVYTEVARKARVTGVVIVEAIIDEKGNVTNARVLKGLPMGLDKAALDAVQRWRFKPAEFQGRPVKVYYTLTVNFQVQ